MEKKELFEITKREKIRIKFNNFKLRTLGKVFPRVRPSEKFFVGQNGGKSRVSKTTLGTPHLNILSGLITKKSVNQKYPEKEKFKYYFPKIR